MIVSLFWASLSQLNSGNRPSAMNLGFALLVLAGNMLYLSLTMRSFRDPLVLVALTVSAIMGGYIYSFQ
jgi:glucan phosphoethanolaminetransferase (alkaline phosphatase superfamily)